MPPTDDGPENPGTNVLRDVARGLARVPAYLLVFAVALVPAFTGALPVVTIATLVAAVLVVALVESGNRRKIATANPEQARRLGALPERETAIRTVLEAIVAPDQDVKFLYATALVEGYTRLDRTPTVYNYKDPDLRVTPILDARGLSYLHSLLNLAGKTQNIQIMTSLDWQDDYWCRNLILVGSPNANMQMQAAAEQGGCPFRFNAKVTAIVENGGGPGRRWPEAPDGLQEAMLESNGNEDYERHDVEALSSKDYAIVAKIKRRSADGSMYTYLIVAGIGPSGTLGGCYYLWNNIVSLAQRFGSDPFAGVLEVDRAVGFTSTREATPFKTLPVAPM